MDTENQNRDRVTLDEVFAELLPPEVVEEVDQVEFEFESKAIRPPFGAIYQNGDLHVTANFKVSPEKLVASFLKLVGILTTPLATIMGYQNWSQISIWLEQFAR